MYKITYDNRIGDVPMTMQGFLNRFEKDLYLEVKNEYEDTYGLAISSSLPTNINNDGNQFYLNFSAYLVLDKDNNVVDYAFVEFNDLVWIFKLIGKNGISFETTDSVYERGIAPVMQHFDQLIIAQKID